MLSSAALLTELEGALPELYAAVLALPELEPSDEPWPAERDGHEQLRARFHDLRAALGPYDLYREIFDPAALAEPGGAIDGGADPVVASLADDLSDIWWDLTAGLRRWGPASEQERLDVVWCWRESFAMHWGQHLVDALRAVHWWRHVHHVGERDARAES